MTNPIPTKFDDNDGAWLDLLCKQTGLKRSEVIRRAVRLLGQEVKKSPRWNWVAETAGELPALDAQQLALIAQDEGKPPKDFDEANARAKGAAEESRRRPRR